MGQTTPLPSVSDRSHRNVPLSYLFAQQSTAPAPSLGTNYPSLQQSRPALVSVALMIFPSLLPKISTYLSPWTNWAFRNHVQQKRMSVQCLIWSWDHLHKAWVTFHLCVMNTYSLLINNENICAGSRFKFHK